VVGKGIAWYLAGESQRREILMLNRIHQRLGTAGFIISIIALVAALGGVSYAASGGLTGKQKKEVEKIAKTYAGKPGAPGATGPAGSPGVAGAAGAKGDKGDAGTNGTNGTNGNNGKSVEVGTATTAECKEGGATVQVAGEAATKKHICNGSPWTAGGTLPSGKSETGTWDATLTSTEEYKPAALASISFSIPLEANGEAFVFTEGEVEEEEFGASGCTGEFNLPVAPPGVLCVFTTSESSNGHVSGPLFARTASGRPEVFGPTGAVLYGFTLTGTAEHPANMAYTGTWAVTAP
jgi:hypothetical protein